MKRKVRFSGHVVRAKGTLANTILQGKVEGGKSRGKPARQWLDDVKEWTEPEDHVTWRKCASVLPKRTE